MSLYVIDSGWAASPEPKWVWYTSYGSNMYLERLAYYIKGGQPPGASKKYPGCRDRRMPSRSVSVELQGALYFATESLVWGGGRAFYDPTADGKVFARAHLVSASQFSDIAAQEMYRSPGEDIDLSAVLSSGVARLGDGRYETLVLAGGLEKFPVLTFTAPWGVVDVSPVPPTSAYLRFIASGLLEAGSWDAGTVAAYLAKSPGAAGHWTAEEIRSLIAE
ncbi:histone deacetylase [Streptomyces griseus]|uniref:histone deacetylase n=1 Tax=Streptomyces griseus TaxID=1911 RepID=UPI0033A8E56E